MIFDKPSVKQYPWFRVSDVYSTECVSPHGGVDVFVCQQYDQEYPIDHYRLWIDGKMQRKTYFGETAYNDVVRALGDMVHWSCQPTVDDLYILHAEKVD